MKRILIILYSVFCTLYSFGEVKYVFYFIGDGMGSNHVLAAEMYRSALQGEPLGRVQTLMTTFPYTGQAATFSFTNGITDSSAAGTCLASGRKTRNSMIGMGPDSVAVRSIAEELKEQGWGIGLMTTVAIDHATPAPFYAHVPYRNMYYEIGQQLSTSRFDFFGGAGFHYPQGEKDDKEVNLYRLAEQSGYTIAHGYEEAQKLVESQEPKVERLILVQKDDDQGAKHSECLPYLIDRKEGDLTLRQITSVAIPFLSSRYDRFFMMIEGGMIDYACHGDDGATAIGEVWDMDDAMQEAYAFYLAHPDETLIVVTADHETGGMALGNGGPYILNLDLLQNQKCSSWVLSDIFSDLFKNNRKPTWEEVQTVYREKLGFWDKVNISVDEEKKLKKLYKAACAKKTKDTKTLYKNINKLGDTGIALLNKKAHIGWTTHSHSAAVVPIFAIGPGAENFIGWHDNTEMVPLIHKAITGNGQNEYRQLAQELAKSEMTHHPELWTCDGAAKPKWEYTPTLMARTFVELYNATGDSVYLNHAQRFADQFIGKDGSILTYKKSLYNMDRIQGGNFLILLDAVNPQPQYKIAIETLRNQLREQPRTTEGGFWHKQVYEHQMWLDGLFTGTTFYARYAAWKPEPEAWSDIANQFLVIDSHTRKANGLNHHGWDESRKMGWSNPKTGCSPETWGRAEGWYVMALCDVLEQMPANLPQRPEVEAILTRVMEALLRVQDKDSHLWYQVPDRTGEEGNYLESTCSAMYCYAMAKGVRIGVLPKQYKNEAKKVLRGLMTNKIQPDDDGSLSLIDCCAVAGLGGNPYRDGTYEYYIHERICKNDPKGVAPLILACLELAK